VGLPPLRRYRTVEVATLARLTRHRLACTTSPGQSPVNDCPNENPHRHASRYPSLSWQAGPRSNSRDMFSGTLRYPVAQTTALHLYQRLLPRCKRRWQQLRLPRQTIQRHRTSSSQRHRNVNGNRPSCSCTTCPNVTCRQLINCLEEAQADPRKRMMDQQHPVEAAQTIPSCRATKREMSRNRFRQYNQLGTKEADKEQWSLGEP